MPKRNIIKVKIDREQPDACCTCPLIGLVPKYQLSKGSQETHVCMAMREAMTARKARSKRSEADAKHPRHRYCDHTWEAWRQNGYYGVPVQAYISERLPWEESQQLPIIFHEKRGPKKKEI